LLYIIKKGVDESYIELACEGKVRIGWSLNADN
jgi:hypothetical protein